MKCRAALDASHATRVDVYHLNDLGAVLQQPPPWLHIGVLRNAIGGNLRPSIKSISRRHYG